MSLAGFFDRILYPAYDDSWDDSLFRSFVEDVISSDMTVLDLGAGRGAKPHLNFLGKVKFVAGVDPDNGVFENPFLDEAKRLEPPTYLIPYPDSSFDIVFSNNVLEHISDPVSFFTEVKRVLKPQGKFLAKTPNKYHYVAILARCTPHWFHAFYNKLRGRKTEDTFPTVYACNSRASMKKIFGNLELEIEELRIIEGRPEYLRLFWPLYLLGAIFERLVNSTKLLETLRCVILVRISKYNRTQAGQ